MHELAAPSGLSLDGEPARPARRPRRGRDGPLAILPVVLLAFASLWWPEAPDQQLFAQAAERLNDGGVYYRDLWDIKQPGIYWFYQLGDLIAPDGLGTRLLEAALAVAAAVLVRALTARWKLSRGARLAAPTLVLGPYLLYSALFGVGQVEGLMNVLLVAVLAGTWPRADGPMPRWAWFLAGVAVGVIGVLKTIYLPIALVPVVVALVAGRGRWSRLAGLVGGTALVALGTVAYLASHGVWDVAWWTSVDLPPEVARITGGQNAGLKSQPFRAVLFMLPLTGVLAVAGLAAARRRPMPVLASTLTAAVALPLALAQLWTPYRFLMFAAPVGLLAALGLDALRPWLRRRRVLALGIGVVLALPMLVPALGLPHSGGLGLDARIRRGETSDPVTHPHAMASIVAGRVHPGEPILMMGDPRILSLLGARSATPIPGWVVQPLVKRVWAAFIRQIDAARPELAFVDTRDWDVGGTGWSGGVFERLARDYQVIARTPDGTWYQRR